MYQYINKIVTIIFVHNWIAILYFNFKKLPFKQAIKLPYYMKDLLSNKILEKDTLINIGSFNWIGNRCSIMKGTITPNNVIIASNSLCNKDYSLTPEFSVLAGSPAKVVKNNIKRLFEGTDI